ncbi:Odorant-binding protein 19d [Carabus blaptoides fortunei]
MCGFNMKLAALALVCLFQVNAVDENDIKEALLILAKECQEETGASDADLDAFRARKLPESPEGKRMVKCVVEKSKTMVDGKFSKEDLIAVLAPLMSAHEEKIETLKERLSDLKSRIPIP